MRCGGQAVGRGKSWIWLSGDDGVEEDRDAGGCFL